MPIDVLNCSRADWLRAQREMISESVNSRFRALHQAQTEAAADRARALRDAAIRRGDATPKEIALAAREKLPSEQEIEAIALAKGMDPAAAATLARDVHGK